MTQMDSYNHKKQLPIEISFGNFVKVYSQRFAILISIALINILLFSIPYLFIFIFYGSKNPSLIADNFKILYFVLIIISMITLGIVIINFKNLNYYVAKKIIERQFESKRKQLYKRVAKDINYKLKKNIRLSLEEKQKLESQLNKSVRKLDLKMMLELYCIVNPEESSNINLFY